MLTSEYSLWFLPLCVLVGIGYAMILYFRIKKPEFPVWVKRTIFFTRALSVSLLVFLLLNPFLKTSVKESEKPIIVIGIDNSESILLNKDSAFYKNDFSKQLHAMIDNLSKKHQVDILLFGDSLKNNSTATYTDKLTDMSAFFENVETRYFNRNVGAVVCLSDGIFNAGKNPLYVANQLKYPIYTVAMGDTSVRKDAFIARVNYNKTVFKNNFFPLEILVQANKLPNVQTKLRITYKENVVFEKNIRVLGNEYSEWVRMNFEAKESGLHRYKIELLPVDEEITTANNTYDAFVEVVDQRKKIGIVYNAPHPDVGAIVKSIESSTFYQVESFLLEEINLESNYDILILHQLPSQTNQAAKLFDYIAKTEIPVWYILGKQTNFNQLNTLNTGVQIRPNKNMKNDAYPIYNQNFSTFIFSPASQYVFSSFPPVEVPFGEYKLSNNATVFLQQKINGVTTSYPLFVFIQNNNKKSAVFTGNGLWRWRMHNYLSEQNHEAFDELVSKTLQYLTVKDDKSFFRIAGKNIYNENEPVLFDAELYNQNYEPVNDPEVTMTIRSKDKQYTYAFSRTYKSYHLNAGHFPEGDYSWTANVTYANNSYTKSGHFSIKKINIEGVNLMANHQLMKNLSAINEAEMFYPNELNKLEATIAENEEIKTSIRYVSQNTPLLNSAFYMIFILLLLGIEWVLRKWSGSY